MIIVWIGGGLGNQMQQYALSEKLMNLGKEVKHDLSWFEKENQEKASMPRPLELDTFSGTRLIPCTASEKHAFLGSDGFFSKLKRKVAGNSLLFRESKMYHPEIFDMEQGYVQGYFACEKYYADILPDLRRQFVFPKSAFPENERKNEQLKEEMKQTFSVSVHLRRGDYLDAENAALLGGICTPAYYEGAVEEIRRHAEGPLSFYVFSDDPEYASTLHFGKPDEKNTVVDWNTGAESLLDMELMSSCRANICANSTFSFWGARLNAREDKISVRPSSHRNNQISVPEEMHDYWKNWILVDREGRLF